MNTTKPATAAPYSPGAPYRHGEIVAVVTNGIGATYALGVAPPAPSTTVQLWEVVGMSADKTVIRTAARWEHGVFGPDRNIPGDPRGQVQRFTLPNGATLARLGYRVDVEALREALTPMTWDDWYPLIKSQADMSLFLRGVAADRAQAGQQ